MSEKKPTIAILKRKVERLEARIAVLEHEIDRHQVIYRERLYYVVDAELRIKQAMAILIGDEA